MVPLAPWFLCHTPHCSPGSPSLLTAAVNIHKYFHFAKVLLTHPAWSSKVFIGGISPDDRQQYC